METEFDKPIVGVAAVCMRHKGEVDMLLGYMKMARMGFNVKMGMAPDSQRQGGAKE
ncbi:MAG: hypothetical protein AB7E49_08330 [Campylobacterales bacterium]